MRRQSLKAGIYANLRGLRLTRIGIRDCPRLSFCVLVAPEVKYSNIALAGRPAVHAPWHQRRHIPR